MGTLLLLILSITCWIMFFKSIKRRREEKAKKYNAEDKDHDVLARAVLDHHREMILRQEKANQEWLEQKMLEEREKAESLSDETISCNIDFDSATLNDVDNMDGHEFEEFCADLLRKNGFVKVRTTKGSGDQGVDILAEKDDISYAIQCKNYSSDLGNKPIQEVFAGKSFYHCHVAAVLTNRYFTQGGIDAAKATGVLLWDRRKLQEFIVNAYGD